VDSFTLQHEPPLLARLPEDWRARHTFAIGSPAEPTRLPYPSAKFDAVFSVGVLEHVRETGGTEAGSLAEIARVLRPGGVFLCFHLPNRWSWIEWACRFFLHDAPADAHRRHHLYRYSLGGAVHLFDASGFRVVEIRRYGFVPRNVLGRLPEPLRNGIRFTRLVNLLDLGLESVFAPLTQNLGIVARRR
jgi:SAM-dependent methyltransferase